MVVELKKDGEQQRLTPADIEAFLQNAYPMRNERDHLKRVQAAELAREPMPKNCRIVVDMPVFHQEKHLKHALRQYLGQDLSQQGFEFEIAVHINGPKGVKIEDSLPYKQAREFQEQYPQLRLVITTQTYGAQQTTISRIRKDLASTTLIRASKTEGMDLDNLILVTHDADLQELEPNYLAGIVQEFDKNPRLNGLAGFCDFPQKDFYQDHLFFAVQRFHDMVDLVNLYREGVKIFRGGASAFRTRAYIEAGGIGHKRKMSELRPLVMSMGASDPGSLQFSRKLGTITTSARRQMMALGEAIPLSRIHDNFGEPGDLADRYQVPLEELKIPEIANKVTSEDFKDKLEKELDALYRAQIYLKRGNVEAAQKLFRTVGFYAGVKVGFEEGRLVVLDFSVLKKNILTKLGSF